MHEEEDIMFKGMKAQRRLAFGVALTLSAGGGLLFSPSVQAAEEHSATIDSNQAGGVNGTGLTGYSSNNHITFTGNDTSPEVHGNIYGAKTDDATNVTSNTITINGLDMIGYGIYGGWTSLGSATGNTVNYTLGSLVGGTVNGGYVDNAAGGSASDNHVTISGTNLGSSTMDVHGGLSKGTGDAKDNTVDFGSTSRAQYVFGGYLTNETAKGEASRNTVAISGGSVNTVWGGATDGRGKLHHNTVTISGGTVANVYGGQIDNANTESEASENTVTITGNSGNISKVYGGHANKAGGATKNTVNVSGGSASNLYGGYAVQTGAASENTVNVSGGSASTIYGGYGKSSGAVKDNTVNISDTGTVTTVYGGYTNNGGAADGNKVNISGGTINGTIRGGYTDAGGSANGNKVTISGGTGIGRVYGGEAKRSDGSASNNEIVISGGSFNTNSVITGGLNSAGSSTYSGSVTGNSIKITGGIFGTGTAITGGTASGTPGGGAPLVNGHTVTLGDKETGEFNATLTGASIWGSYRGTNYASSAEQVKGNTLNVNAKGISLTQLRNFENYNFNLTKNISNGDTMITITESMTGAKYDWSKINLDVSEWTKDASKFGRSTVDLMRHSSGSDIIIDKDTYQGVKTGVSGDFEYTVRPDNDSTSGMFDKATQYIRANVDRFQHARGVYNGAVRPSDGNVYGGYSSGKNTTTDNRLKVTGLPTGNLTAVYGGYTDNASGDGTKDSTQNTVTITSSVDTTKTIDSVYGGYTKAASGKASENKATIENGNITGNVVGGFANGSGSAAENIVNLYGGTIGGSVYGGQSTSGATTKNTVNIGDGEHALAKTHANDVGVTGTIYGGSGADKTGNTLNVRAAGYKAGNIANFDQVNFSFNQTMASDDTLLTLTNNGTDKTKLDWSKIGFGDLNADGTLQSGRLKLKLLSGEADGLQIANYTGSESVTLTADGKYERGIYADGTTANGTRTATNIFAVNNQIKGANVVFDAASTRPADGDVYGGYSSGGNTTTENTVTIKALPTAGLNNIYGAMTDTTTATAHSTHNKVNIESTVGTAETIGNVYGGYTRATTGDATHNTVNLRGGHITGDVYGGKADGTGVTTNNTVNIEGTGITVGGVIAGGNKDDKTENKLNVRGTASAKTIEKFDIITFALNAVKAGGDAMLTLNDSDDAASEVTTTTLDWSKLKVENGTGGTASTYESTWTLMHAGGNDKLDFGTTYDHAKEYGAADGDYELTVDKNADNTKVTATGYRFRNNTEAAYTATDQNHAVVWGGRSDKGNTVENNTLTVSGGEITDGVYGGLATKGAAESTAQNNTLHLTGGTINDAFGGASYSNFDTPATRMSAGRAIGNRVVLEFASTATPAEKVHSVTGGYGATATDNTVEIKSGKVDDGVIGGAAKNGTAERNTVTVADGVIGTTVTGGYGATAVDNTVEIKAGTVSGADFNNQHVAALGGHSETDHGTASQNYVSVSGGTISGGVIGGAAKNGTAERNTVAVADGTTITGAVAGGGSYDFTARDNTGSGSGSYNVVHIGDNVALNRRDISGNPDINQNVQGGQGAAANYNSVSIGASDLNNNKYIKMDVGGGYGGTANYNMVTLNGTVVSGDVTGGRATNGDAVGNTISLTDGYVMGKIYGGVVNATHRSLNNTLAIRGFNTKVGDIDNASIQNLHFYIPADTTSDVRDTMLYIKNALTTGKDLRGMNIGVALAGNRPTLGLGDTISLVKTYKNNSTADADAVPLTTDDTLVNRTEGMQGVSLRYGFDLMKGADNELVAKVNSVALNEQTKSLVETRAASAALINSGADLLTDSSMNAAIEAASVAPRTVPGGSNDFNLWAAQGGSSLRLNSGSHVDAKGWNINLGFAKKAAAGRNTITYGPFLEYGRGTYDSYLDDGTHGDGKTSYFGGGVMAKVQSAGGTYVEGSLRAGRVKSDYNGNISGTNTGYDNSSTYYAAHIGIGQEKELKNGSTIEGYAKYFYAHQGGNTTTLRTGETYEFDSVNSNRIRIGTRYTHKMPRSGAFYTGLAYEYEFGSEAGASYQGYSTPSPSLKGSTGILELGYRFTPKESRVSYGVNLMGMTGKRRGITGGVQMTWAF
ncbi:outer membrane autotransporter barrel domain protein [Selenomonas artemidis F0399]|uniref:Outer membrane autotransporter barrel domain protein n=2 Tax=Selenomonas TaxID=970 RepID=E7N147_9FIRM|nr:outer membrane autotransporter barrel domain protein [Selenomonas artemidis F0399]